MKDIQKEKPLVSISIEKVGIKGILYPVRILRKDNNYQHTIATIQPSVELPSTVRGTHMSRFVELIEKYKQDINGKSVKEILKDITKTFDCQKASLLITFPYFITKISPVSRTSSIMNTVCGYRHDIVNNEITATLLVKVDVTTLCPCSKSISKYGAHNQRTVVTLEVEEKDFIWFEDLIDLVEQCASSSIYPLLKREDEKYVTEHAYENPKFVEDLVRDIYIALKEKYKTKISKVKIEVESNESIHQHKAFAIIEKSLN